MILIYFGRGGAILTDSRLSTRNLHAFFDQKRHVTNNGWNKNGRSGRMVTGYGRQICRISYQQKVRCGRVALRATPIEATGEV